MASVQDLLGDYWVGEEIGRGARSVVYEVRQRATGNSLAAKFVAVNGEADLGIVRHLENERRVLVALHRRPGPGAELIVRSVELLRRRRWFKTLAVCHVMELAPGRSLAERRDYPMEVLLEVFRKVCLALEHVHAAGYVHADLKPDNILVHDDDIGVKLIDFGFTLPIGTTLKGLKGTWGYMAPEQAGGTLNELTDVFNLGAAMYWVFSGEHLPRIVPDVTLRSSSLRSTSQNGADGYVPRRIRLVPPSHHNPQVPEDLSDLILRCCHYKAHRRPAVAEVYRFLGALALRLRLSR